MTESYNIITGPHEALEYLAEQIGFYFGPDAYEVHVGDVDMSIASDHSDIEALSSVVSEWQIKYNILYPVMLVEKSNPPIWGTLDTFIIVVCGNRRRHFSSEEEAKDYIATVKLC